MRRSRDIAMRTQEQTMPIEVIAHAGHRGDEEPRAVVVDGERRAIVETVRRWREPEGRFFDVRLDDDRRLVLRHADGGWSVVERPSVVERTETPGEARCLECGAAVLGAYCQDCGQRHASRIQPFRELVVDAFDDVLSLDNRVLRSLALLLRRPGALTEAYLAGRRVRYTTPFRLYLITSVFYFFVAFAVDAKSFLFGTTLTGDGTSTAVAALPKIFFLSVPFFALILKWLYRRWLYVEHLIFALHVYSFWFAASTISAALDGPIQAGKAGTWTVLTATAVVIGAVITLALPSYLFLAQRRVYGARRRTTLWKTVVILSFNGIAIGLLVAAYIFLLALFGQGPLAEAIG